MVVQRAKVPDATDPSADIIPSAMDEGFALSGPFFHISNPGHSITWDGRTRYNKPWVLGVQEAELGCTSRSVPH